MDELSFQANRNMYIWYGGYKLFPLLGESRSDKRREEQRYHGLMWKIIQFRRIPMKTSSIS
jgi:hypothetical protein